MSNNRRYVGPPLWVDMIFPGLKNDPHETIHYPGGKAWTNIHGPDLGPIDKRRKNPQLDIGEARGPIVPVRVQQKRPEWLTYCASDADLIRLAPKGWAGTTDPPAPERSPWEWRCIVCRKKLTRGFYICAEHEAEYNCKGRDLTADNPRCQPGGDLHLIYELKCMERADRDRARAGRRREVAVDPDILLSPKSHDPDEREEGWDAPSELSATFAPERDDDAITMDDVAVTQRLATGYYGQAGRLAVEHSWNAPKRRVYDAWRYTRSEYATDLTLWEPYPDESLNKQYRKAYKGRLYRKRQAKRATETADGAEERLDGWRAELERLLTTVALSPAERQILELASKGIRQADIAATMGLSQSRVSQVLSATLAKLRGPQARPERDPWRRIIRPKEPPAPTGGHVVTAGPYRTDALRSYWQDNPDKASWRETPKHLR